VTITRTNAERVAENAVSAVAALNGLAFLNQDVLDGIVGTSAARLSSFSGKPERGTARLLARVPRSAALLSGEVTVDCDTGTATISVTDQPPLDLLSPGDTGSIQYNACVLAGTTLGGTVSFAVTQNDNFPATPFHLEIDYTIGNLSATEPGFSTRINGSFGMIASADALGQVFETTVEGGPLTLVEQAAGQTTSATLSGFAASTTRNDGTGAYGMEVLSAALAVSSAALSGSMTFQTTQTLVGTGDDPPSQGELRVAGNASNLWVTKPVSTPDVQIWVDTNGDGTRDGDPIATTWTALGW
jgi:hypothetical protein